MSSASAKSIPNLKPTRNAYAQYPEEALRIRGEETHVSDLFETTAPPNSPNPTVDQDFPGFSHSLACQVCPLFFENAKHGRLV